VNVKVKNTIANQPPPVAMTATSASTPTDPFASLDLSDFLFQPSSQQKMVGIPGYPVVNTSTNLFGSKKEKFYF